jgi:chemotaxis family two-component system response regulator Rcp1
MGKPAAVRIALAEDSGSDVILIEETLRSAGLVVELRVFRDGEDCACYLRSGETPPDAIILDLNLPRLDGFELLRVVRSDPRYRAVPVAVLTSSRLAEDERRSFDLGANAFITKPCSLDAFLETVGGAIRELVGGIRLPEPS